MAAIKIIKQKSLKSLSTFGIGGKAERFVSVNTTATCRETFLFAKKRHLPVHILGNGSNCLFPDQGLPGLIVQNKILFYRKKQNQIFVGGGYSLALLGRKTAKNQLTGFEFALSIPGSVGGAIWMNAGASGQETADTLVKVAFMDLDGRIAIYQKKALRFGYRSSSLQEKKGMILWACFLLSPSSTAANQARLFAQKRRQDQPLQEKSIGSIFKNPANGISAARLIDQAGLKGLQIGGAKISLKHANFIINTGNATSGDVALLVEKVQQMIYAKYGMWLEKEICTFL